MWAEGMRGKVQQGDKRYGWRRPDLIGYAFAEKVGPTSV
jgi:hypothetical protein